MEEDRLSNLPNSLLFEVFLNLPTKDVVKTSVLSSRWKKLWRFVPGLNLNSSHVKYGEKSVCEKQVDRLSNLPESLLFEILLNLSTKDVVKTSVLSTRWKKLWRFVPGLNLDFSHVVDEDRCSDFTAFAVFVEIFLAFNSRPCLQNLKLKYHRGAHSCYLTPWIETAIKRKVQHLHVLEGSGWRGDYYYEVKVPPTVYTCESLVSLKLSHVTLPSPEFVSLPQLKYIHLERVKFAKDPNAIDLNEDLPKIDVMRNFLVAISNVKDMVISFDTLEEVLCGYSTCEPLPLFCNLSSLSVKLPKNKKWNMMLLVIFLESCPNLKSLVLQRASRYPVLDSTCLLSVPQCLKSSIEYVEIERPSLSKAEAEAEAEARAMERPSSSAEAEAMENLVSYFLKSSAILKKLTISLDEHRKEKASVILERLQAIPKLSTSCQIVVLRCVPRS